eukprot:6923539-Pyramimonas_sp.AAC.1
MGPLEGAPQVRRGDGQPKRRPPLLRAFWQRWFWKFNVGHSAAMRIQLLSRAPPVYPRRPP